MKSGSSQSSSWQGELPSLVNNVTAVLSTSGTAQAACSMCGSRFLGTWGYAQTVLSMRLHPPTLHCLPYLLHPRSLSLLSRGDAENQRRDLTGRVRQYVAEQNASGNQGLVLVDMESAFDYYKLSEQRRKELFDDGIHLTQAGYNLMGDLVFQALERAMAV